MRRFAGPARSGDLGNDELNEMTRTAAVASFWQMFKSSTACTAELYDVVAFGDSPAMANELGHLVLAGGKRATAGLLGSFKHEGLPVPAVGDYVIVVDGNETPLCIYRTTEVRVGPLSSVDESFAWDEGEGERTREWWLAAHMAFFTRESERYGFAMHDAIETVFERFELVWPEWPN